ncbi:hypothetical protein K438DRAFT_1865226, partial [Mycena galopus ATCC 62051]
MRTLRTFSAKFISMLYHRLSALIRLSLGLDAAVATRAGDLQGECTAEADSRASRTKHKKVENRTGHRESVN